MKKTTPALIALISLALLQPCCARTDDLNGQDADVDGTDYDGDTDSSDGGGDADSDTDADADGDFEMPPQDVLIYAHSADTLYGFSASRNEVVSSVPFVLSDGTAAPHMVDLAVNAAGEIYTSGDDELFTVDPVTGETVPVGVLRNSDGQLLNRDLGLRLYALTFVPRSLFPDAETTEVLIGAANEGECFIVDPATALCRALGSYPAAWRSSGDLVSVEGLGTTFATLREEGGEYEDPDYLAEITFLPGGRIELSAPQPIRAGDRAFVQIFGLGYWGRSLYGFSNSGELVEIDRDSAVGSLATEDTGASQFWGAGVTTQVPVVY